MKNAYDEKMAVLDPEIRSAVEREIFLKTLDQTWRDHLYQMDTMKTGIRLRAYNQKDPLVEFKKESFNLFTELRDSIKFETIKMLQIIQFKAAEEEAEALAEQREIQKRQDEMNMHLNHSDSEVVEKKVARNDPCPCGSGKKYKSCCGKSGPKKGALAQGEA